MGHVFETWFPYVKAELSEDTEIRFGRVVDGGNEMVDWSHVDHAHRDGAGAFVDVLERHGFQVPVPTARFAGKATVAAWLAWARESRKSSGLSPLRWRPDVLSASRESSSPAGLDGGRIAWREVSDSLVDAMERHTAGIGVSVNSLLTWAVARSLVPAFQIIEQDEAIHVGLATNTRNPGNSDRSNHSLQFNAAVSPEDDPRDVHRQVRNSLRSQAVKALDRYYRIASMVPRPILRRIISRDFRGKKRYRPMSHALISNLGQWDVPGENAVWVFLPCALIHQPLAIGAISVNGRLVLAIKLHHSIGISSTQVETALSDFIDFLEQSCASPVSSGSSAPATPKTIGREPTNVLNAGET